jgi:hypothetical protein
VKKYVVALVLLFAVHNMCAMELDPFDRCFKYDEKCRLVAKYLHKYPKGENEFETREIKCFFEDRQLERLTVSPLLVTKYKKILDNIEAEKYLRSICRELPIDLKQRIFTEALWYPAREYYSTHNVLKFMAMQQPDFLPPRYNPHLIQHFYKPYFLDEIDEKKASIDFNIVDDRGMHDALGFIITDSHGRKIIKLKASYSNGRWLKDVFYKCAKETIEELISFLDGKNARVDAFKVMFNEHIKHLTLMDEENSINRFVELLTLFNDLTKRAIVLYTGKDRLM